MQKSKNNNKRANTQQSKSRRQRAPTKVPAAIGYVAKNSPPALSNTRSVRVVRREMAGTCTNVAAGYQLLPLSSSVPGWDINPGCATLFPWLSNFAPCFERYRFHRLRITIIPSQATSTPGRVYMAVDLDYDDPPATGKMALMGNKHSVEAPVWQSISVDVPASDLHRDMPFKYVNYKQRSANPEPRTAFCGYLQIATDTTQTNCLFDIWVDYDVEFVDPVSEELMVQDTISSGLSTPLPLISSPYNSYNIGSGQIQELVLSSKDSIGPVKVVKFGINGTPAVAIHAYTGNKVAEGYGYDLVNVLNGTLELVGMIASAFATPLDYAEQSAAFDVEMYSEVGTSLGLMSTASAGSINNTMSTGAPGDATNSTLWNTAGSTYKGSAGIHISDLRRAVPTIRYLLPFIRVPVLKAILDLGGLLGTSLHGLKYEL